MTAYVVWEDLVAGVPDSNQVQVTFPEPIEAGDTLILMVGGGNQVPTAPTGWTSRDFRTGQEAQGRVLTRVVSTAEPSGLTVTIGFDGNDRCGVGMVHVRGEVGIEIPYAERVGSVGASLGSYGVGFGVTANVLTYLFGFQRNSGGGYATVAAADQIGGEANGAEGISLYRVAPTEPATATWATTAGRSGHYLAAIELYSIVRTPWQYDAEKLWMSTTTTVEDGFQLVDTPDEQIPFNDTRADAADHAFDGNDVTFPTSGIWGSRIEYGFTNLAGTENDGWQVTWQIRAINMERLTSVVDFTGNTGTPPADVQDPETGLLVDPDALDIEWNPDPGPALRQKVSATVNHLNVINSGSTIGVGDREFHLYVLMSGAGGGVQPTSYLSPSVIGQTFQYVGAVRWDDVHPAGDPGMTPTVVEGVVLGNPTVPARAVLIAVDPTTLDEQPLLSAVEPDGLVMQYATASLRQEYQPSYRLLYRGPVTVGPLPVVSVLRRYPRDDAYGFGNVRRTYPAPRRLRTYGRQP